MVRLLGAVLVAGGAAWAGLSAAEGLKRRVRALDALVDGLSLLEQELELDSPPLPELMERLALDPEKEHTLVFVRRRVLADETPVLYSTDILPLALFGGKRLDAIDFSRPIFEIVEQHCRVEVAETLTTLHAVMGTPGIRRQLGVRPDQALLQLDEICYSRTCKPVLCCQTCYTDFFDFAMVRKLV